MGSYHPKRRDKEITEKTEIDKIVKNGKYITLSMANNDFPYIVALSYGYDESSNCLYFHSANHGTKLEYLEINDKTCGIIIEDRGYLKGQCDHDYASVVIRGKIKKIDSIEEKRHGLNILLNHLEDNPAPILERNIKDDNSFNVVTILKLEIESIIGKEYKR